MRQKEKRGEAPWPTERAAALPLQVLGAGPRVVLLHGGPGLDHHCLLPLATELADAFEVVLPDLPGHGAEAHGRPPTLSEVVAHVERFLLGVRGQIHALVGHSLGAWVAREVARRGRFSPAAWVLIAPPCGGRAAPPWPALRRAGRASGMSAAEQLLQEVRAQTGRQPSADFAEALRASTLHAGAHYEALIRALTAQLEKPTPKLKLSAPVLVLGGERDPVVMPHEAAAVAAATGNAAHVSLPAMGHYPAATEHDGAARALREFLLVALGLR